MAKTPPQVAVLDVTLLDMPSPVTRKIEIPAQFTLDRLHDVLQAAMPWSWSHLWSIEQGDRTWSDPEFEMEGWENAKKARIDACLRAPGDRLTYRYDFGDDWEHLIVLDRFAPRDSAVLTPRILEAQGRCPPEDCGGAPGYHWMLVALADPKHPDHLKAKEIAEFPFPWDPSEPDWDVMSALVKRFANRWKPRKPRA